MRPWMKWTLIVLVGLLPLEAVTAVWFWATGQVTAQSNAWIADRRARGWIISSGEPAREGWPFDARIRLPQVSISSPALPSRLSGRLEADAATVGVRLWAPYTLHVGLHGEQRFVLQGRGAQTFTTSRTELMLPLSEGRPPDYADMMINDLSIIVAPVSLHAAGIQVHSDFGTNHLAVALHMSGVDLPGGPLATPLGTLIEQFGLEFTSDGPPTASPAAWKAAGGLVHLTSLVLDWGKLRIAAHGQFRLDDQLQPEGDLIAAVIGAGDVLDALVATRAVQPGTATATRAFLTLMQKPQSDGTQLAEFPFTLKNQRVQMGQFPLTRVPDIRW